MDTAKKQNHPNQAHADERRKLRIEYENAEPENRRDNTDDSEDANRPHPTR